MPFAEIACTKDYPGAWAEYRVYEGGYTQMVRRVTSTQGWEVPMTGVVPRFTATPGTIRHAGPRLGEHTEEVLADILGLRPAVIDELRATGAVGVPPVEAQA